MTKVLQGLIFTICAIATNLTAQAQDVLRDTIRWTASGFNDVRTSREVDAGCQFITYRKDKIEWIQNNGKLTYEMPIRRTSGNWNNIERDGSVDYAVELDKVAGRLTIRRVRGQLFIILIFDYWSGGPIENRYRISKAEALK